MSERRRRRRWIPIERRGFALLMAIVAIMMTSAMLAGAFAVSMREYRFGGASYQQTQAMAAAEAGIVRVMLPAEWPRTIARTPIGEEWQVVYRHGPADVDTVRLTRLARNRFMVVSEAFVGAPGAMQARRRAGAILRLRVPDPAFLGALTTRGEVVVGSGSSVDGNDDSPAGWGCDVPTTPLAGVAAPDLTRVALAGCLGGECIAGSPALLPDPRAAADSTYVDFGGVNWDDLVALATTRYPATTLTAVRPRVSIGADGSCAEDAADNWGDPVRGAAPGACEGFFPLIHAAGDLRVDGGAGQGILLVDGDLELTGGAEFYGAVLVRGTLRIGGGGARVTGGVMAASVDSAGVALENATLRFSRCAIGRALTASAPPTFVRDRAWMEIF